MDPLAGWTVAVTSERRAHEQVELLQARDADVVLTPLVHNEPVDLVALRSATERLVAMPPDLVVLLSGIAFRSWIAAAWSWNLGDALLELLRSVEVIARGPKTAAALAGEGIEVGWGALPATMAEVRAAVERTPGLRGRRVVVQPHGGDVSSFAAAVRRMASELVVLPSYERAHPHDATVARFAELYTSGGLDAVMFTSGAAVRAAAVVLDEPAALDAAPAIACVGPVTAALAAEVGFHDVVVAEPMRLGSMVGALGERLSSRSTRLRLGDVPVVLQGSRLDVDGTVVRLTPRERDLLAAMLESQGAVVSKATLASRAWETAVDEHTVEVTVNRLRRKLGAAAGALETSARRGYRLAVA